LGQGVQRFLRKQFSLRLFHGVHLENTLSHGEV
jgi:hypothetical protein